ncbi:LysR family transcriptional regulator [Acinetobacter nectaris]|nr:LysR family transcriptional regulator [Acinetobacter nectaris]
MQRVEMFIAVAETRNFTFAAETLGISKAVISFNIKQLESDLGVSLLTRSTRKVIVTEAGEKFYQRCLILLQHVDDVIQETLNDSSSLKGTFRISTTVEYGNEKIIPILAKFSTLHPNLKIQHTASSKLDDLISERFDIAIRLGSLDDSSYHAKLIDTFEVIPVSSQSYLSKHYKNGKILDLNQFKDSCWIAHQRFKSPFKLELYNTQEEEKICFEMSKNPILVTDNITALRSFVLNSLGVGLLPKWLIEEDLSCNRLIQILPKYQFPKQGVYAIYPNTKHVSLNVRTFIKFLETELSC